MQTADGMLDRHELHDAFDKLGLGFKEDEVRS